MLFPTIPKSHIFLHRAVGGGEILLPIDSNKRTEDEEKNVEKAAIKSAVAGQSTRFFSYFP